LHGSELKAVARVLKPRINVELGIIALAWNRTKKDFEKAMFMLI